MAAGLDIGANILLAKSNGFARKKYGFSSLLLICLAFSCLAYALRGMDLAVAYALWGGFGIIGTSLSGWLLLGQKMHASAWLGIIVLVGGMCLLRFT